MWSIRCTTVDCSLIHTWPPEWCSESAEGSGWISLLTTNKSCLGTEVMDIICDVGHWKEAPYILQWNVRRKELNTQICYLLMKKARGPCLQAWFAKECSCPAEGLPWCVLGSHGVCAGSRCEGEGAWQPECGRGGVGGEGQAATHASPGHSHKTPRLWAGRMAAVHLHTFSITSR